jgi:hypothetical protein
MLHIAVPPEHDIDGSGGDVYSPGSRDRAQSFRDRCVSMLARNPSREAFEALRRIFAALPYFCFEFSRRRRGRAGCSDARAGRDLEGSEKRGYTDPADARGDQKAGLYRPRGCPRSSQCGFAGCRLGGQNPASTVSARSVAPLAGREDPGRERRADEGGREEGPRLQQARPEGRLSRRCRAQAPRLARALLPGRAARRASSDARPRSSSPRLRRYASPRTTCAPR